MKIHPKRVSSAIVSAGFPILGAVSVLILAYSLFPRIKWTGSSFFKSTSSIPTSPRWSYSAKMSLYQGLVRVSGTPRFTFVISVRRRKFPERFSITPSWISISWSVVYMSISIFLNSLRTGCLPIRSSKAAEAYELPAPVSSSTRHRIPQTSTTTSG